MIKALRIAGFVVAGGAVAAAVLLVIQFFAGGTDAETEKLLKAPGVVEAFLESMGDKLAAASDETPALVKEARAFALYLNPPPEPAPPKPVVGRNEAPRPTPEMPPRVTAKFNILGTSVYPADPNKSFALVDEAGAELRWVRQGETVGHFDFEAIRDGLVVLRAGQRTQEMAAIRPVIGSLETGTAGAASVSAAPRPAIPDSMMPVGARDRITGRSSPAAAAAARRAAVSAPATPEIDEAGGELMNEFVERMKAMQTGAARGTGGVPEAAETERLMEELMQGLKASRVSEEEAERLEELGQQLDSQSTSAAPEPRRRRRLPGRSTGKVESGSSDANAAGEE